MSCQAKHNLVFGQRCTYAIYASASFRRTGTIHVRFAPHNRSFAVNFGRPETGRSVTRRKCGLKRPTLGVGSTGGRNTSFFDEMEWKR